jgi:hypothetical protein
MTGSNTTTLKRTPEQAVSCDVPADQTVRVSPVKTFNATVLKAKSLDGEHSLTSMMSSRRSGLHSLHKKFAEEMEQRRRVSFAAASEEKNNSFAAASEEKNSVSEPPLKRRRFQRRNSKTAAMMFNSMASIVSSDLGDSPIDEKPKEAKAAEDSWEGGVEIAEELVRQLKLRRQSLNDALA